MLSCGRAASGGLRLHNCRCRRHAPLLMTGSALHRSLTRVAAMCCPVRFQAASTAAAQGDDAKETAASPSPSSAPSESASMRELNMVYRPRWKYTAFFREKSLTDFIAVRDEHAVSVAQTYRHLKEDITVTLIPLRHFAHPLFFKQVDELCCQHDSVLMEGRVPLTGAPFSTFVPPRDPVATVRPPDHEDDEGWEPREVERFFQPFSWGVAKSPSFTVVHAADKYDYERLPWWCSVRFNTPVVGSLAREQHCTDMIYPLWRNGYKSFAIPWGAAHMPIFHEILLDNDFEPVGMCSLLVFAVIDGDISSGEHRKLLRWKQRRERRAGLLYVVGTLMVMYSLWQSVRVDYRSSPA